MPQDDFADVLRSFSEPSVGNGERVSAVADAVAELRDQFFHTENLGRTSDHADAYYLLEQLVASVNQEYPNAHCKEGCSGCCSTHTAVFDVSPAEWHAIEEALSKWPDDRKTAFYRRFEERHAPRLLAYRFLGMIRYFEPVSERYFRKYPYECPFLENGRCSIYDARPLACRMYGHFAISTGFFYKPSIYGCGLQTAFYSKHRELTLPSVNMVASQTRHLTGGKAKILPIWIAAAR